MTFRPKTKLRGYLFWFFIGGFGAHRFYLRRKKSGFILLFYSVLTTLIDIFAIEIFPNIALFQGETFFWITSIPLWIFLLWDAFQISRWVDEINYEESGPSVFS